MLLSRRSSARSGVVATVALATLAATVLVAPAAGAAIPKIASRTAAGVTADALPTAQLDGVAWTQAISGNTVYVGGDFTTARPAGNAAGVGTVPRDNLMAYTLSTGVMTSFAPDVNDQVFAVAVSPDGTRLYVGGQFTQIGSATRYRIAAFDTATGALVSTFAPQLNYIVRSIVATNTTVYAGGSFATVTAAGVAIARNHAAAFSALDGSLLKWDPNADAQVSTMVLTPNGRGVVLGGVFKNVGGKSAYGLAKVDAVSGALLGWNATKAVRDAGPNAGITSLVSDGTTIYGTGYVYGSGGNLEGSFAADPTTGNITWIEDCHGDTYGAYVGVGAVYTVGHAHDCSTVGGFPDSPGAYHHALAFTTQATGTLGHTALPKYHDWFGAPAPSMINWFPDLVDGTFTGIGQAAWTVTGNSQYVVLGGEFPSVNGTPQQGLVRFAVPGLAPDKQGPMITGADFKPTLAALGGGQVSLTWTSNRDRDDQLLTYTVHRDGNTVPVYTVTAASTFWNRPTLTFTDSGLTPGSHSYRLFVTDPDGNLVKGDGAGISST